MALAVSPGACQPSNPSGNNSDPQPIAAYEELETSKEEMQSLNEELQTVNARFQGRPDGLGQANDDRQNLLNITKFAAIFLDRNHRIKRFTVEATKVIKLIPSDVGRPTG